MILGMVLATVVVAVTSLTADHEWTNFKLEHNKLYSNYREEQLRFKIFSDNLDEINNHNEMFKDGLVTYEMGINQFSDMTDEEFQKYLGYSDAKPLTDGIFTDTYKPPPDYVLPKKVDYREKDAVNPVKNQGACGSCWAFSAVGSLESLSYLKSKKLQSLSEQNLLDCSHKYGNAGCGGGLMRSAYKYIADYGLETEEKYPYTAENDHCKYSQNESVVHIKGFTTIMTGSEHDLQVAIADVGPQAVAVDSSQWKSYKSGIFSADSSSIWLNHGVVAVGFGEENGVEYYIVRNSWGDKWGEEGYIRVARNMENQCGIANDACFPNL